MIFIMFLLSTISTIVILSNLYYPHYDDNLMQSLLSYHMIIPKPSMNQQTESIDKEFEKYQKRPYTKYVELSRFFHHLQDEREMMISTFKNHFINSTTCSSTNRIIIHYSLFIIHRNHIILYNK